MAKTLKFPLALFLLLALAYNIPPDGVMALKCFECSPSGTSAPCDRPAMEDCKPDETICHSTELPKGTVAQRGCEAPTGTKVAGTCPTPDTCYCNTDLCNFNTTTASANTTTTTTNATTTTTTTPRGSTQGSNGTTTTTTTEEMCESGSTSEHGRTPILIISIAFTFFISASFFDNN